MEIAYKTRKMILDGKPDPIAVLRRNLVVATILNKEEEIKWFKKELFGYYPSDTPPDYRYLQCPYEKSGERKKGFRAEYIRLGVHVLSDYLKRKIELRGNLPRNITILVNPSRLYRILAKMIDETLLFLNDTIAELQYGGSVEYLMEEIRKNTDEKLAKLDKKLIDESQSLFLNLASTNPADWNKVGHSCRKILKLLADNVFAPRAEAYQMKDGRTFEVGDPQFINRLCAFFDQKVAGEERKFLCAEIEYLESYLRQVVEYAQMGEHKPSIEKYHANMMAIHTYLIISEILKHKD